MNVTVKRAVPVKGLSRSTFPAVLRGYGIKHGHYAIGPDAMDLYVYFRYPAGESPGSVPSYRTYAGRFYDRDTAVAAALEEAMRDHAHADAIFVRDAFWNEIASFWREGDRWQSDAAKVRTKFS
jgi:hypothetical protein